MRKKLVAGNWKMNMLRERAVDFVRRTAGELETEAVICVPYTLLDVLSKEAAGTKLSIGAQNVHELPSGAFTGEISAEMLADLHIQYVIIGHSERRQYYAESDEAVSRKLRAALDRGLTPVVCCGEPEGVAHPRAFVSAQIENAFQHVSAEELSKTIIAYEPIWAIGTGKTASPEDAQGMIAHLRGVQRLKYGAEAEKQLFLYGGSVKADNIGEFLSCEDIDGALVGGASLDPISFLKMVEHTK